MDKDKMYNFIQHQHEMSPINIDLNATYEKNFEMIYNTYDNLKNFFIFYHSE